MIIEETVMIDDEELKEAILDYINKHKKSSYTTLKNMVEVNGSVEHTLCITGLKFKVE